ncbi:MAG TPA: hypothetical protein VK179_05575 [Bacteroidales bacterium]|nr:hypothetical protein [Bacteroidales bacterium]
MKVITVSAMIIAGLKGSFARNKPDIRINNWIRKNMKIRIPNGLKERASLKRKCIMAEKLLDKPVLIDDFPVIIPETEGTGCTFPGNP